MGSACVEGGKGSRVSWDGNGQLVAKKSKPNEIHNGRGMVWKHHANAEFPRSETDWQSYGDWQNPQ